MADLSLQLQADNLPSEKLENLLVQGPWAPILDRLITGENLLLEGCRGVGKTMLMRAAANRLADGIKKGGRVLGVHTTFKRYLATIPPSDKADTTALGNFKAWVNARILAALRDQIKTVYGGLDLLDGTAVATVDWQSVISSLETTYRGQDDWKQITAIRKAGLSDDQFHALQGYTFTSEVLQTVKRALNLELIILLLDDAAHALDTRAQSEFFTNVKSLYSEGLAFKISVYPAVTRYGLDFSYGHDAVVVSLGQIPKVDDMPYFVDLLQRRLGVADSHGGAEEIIKILLKEHNDWIRLMVYCSNANPRGLLKLVGQVLTEMGVRPPSQVRYEDIRGAINSVMDRHLDNMVPGVIKDLDPRLLRAGELLLDEFRERIRKNPGPLQNNQPRMFLAVTNSMQIPYLCTAAVKLLVAAQVLSPAGSVRLSQKENGTTYLLHPGFVYRDNVIAESSALVPAERWLQHFDLMTPRIRAEITKGASVWIEVRDAANEEPSRRCINGHPMLEAVILCEECGARVAPRGPAEVLLEKDISVLDLSDAIKQRLRSHGFTNIRRVFEATPEEIDDIPYIGDLRVQEIRHAVEAAVDEYFAG